MRLQVGDHLSESRATRSLRRLDIDELAGDGEAICAGIRAQQSQLRGYRKALTFLILAGHACISNSVSIEVRSLGSHRFILSDPIPSCEAAPQLCPFRARV